MGASSLFSQLFLIQREPLAERQHVPLDLRHGGLAFLDDAGDHVADLPHLPFLHAARGDRGRSKAYAAGFGLVARVERDGVAVGGDVRLIQQVLYA